jgi:hypothetical protein
MRKRTVRPHGLLAAAVLGHLVVAAIHGAAHVGAQVPLGVASRLFVLAVILVGPVAGLLISRLSAGRGGIWVIAATMTGALAFGFVNHFVIAGADHVTHVATPWKPMFGITAVLLVATEAAGAAVALWCVARTGRTS